MMEVRLKRTFVYQGHRYRRGIVDLPPDIILPNGAEILDPAEAARRASDEAKRNAKTAAERSEAAKQAAKDAEARAKELAKAAEDAEKEAEAEAKAEADRKAKEAKKTYADRAPRASVNL